ncbi:putative bifunctional diguanylate cyclase/phosphodiesterase [Methylobacterium oryzihabitans]|uniref:putative bifunctional diguanylate cyclase/phosphodiesterase n=1 Tax=Methylobacterium oryzihabitans TaxID=2499852 RepID=UPI001651B8E6|nr:GGDEF domain-containing phosphodiesterase [Methylobacterium oryzihabitans]
MSEADIAAPERAGPQGPGEGESGDETSFPALSRLLALATHLFDVPAVLVSLTGPDGQVVRVAHGPAIPAAEACDGLRHPPVAGDGVDVVLDAAAEGRRPGRAPAFRFTAAVPLRAPDGPALGSLRIADPRPRAAFPAADRATLRDLSVLVLDHLELHRSALSRRATEEHLLRLARLDPLTGLPDRSALRGSLDGLLAGDRPASVLVLDLDGFKEVNDALGRGAGDAVLRLVAERLLGGTGGAGTVARLGGDEFAILLADAGETEADAMAAALTRAFSEPFLHDGHVLHLGTSIGIALHQAKAEGRHCHRVYRPALREAQQQVRRLRGALHDAVRRGEFVLFYQPQVSLADGSLVGAEALLRWRHPRDGLLAPAAFLATLESSSCAAEVGDWVLDQACRQAVRWRARGAPGFRIGVNLSAAQFQRGDLAETVARTLVRTGLPPAGLELEITETIVLRHDDVALAPLARLRALGVGIAFDDYGTGYASLSLLKRYPLTRLKIDRSFVTGMTSSRRDETIVRAILQLGHGFKLDVIAEGIETEREHARLRAKGCREGQGFLFGRPMPAEAFAARYGLDGGTPVPAAAQ